MNVNTASYGPLNTDHVQRIRETLDKALNEHPRTLVIRTDLKLPDEEHCLYNDDSTLITRFITSLKAQISADLQRKRKAGKRVHHCRVRFAWSREFSSTGKKHYHLVLFFNKDVYGYPGQYYAKNDEYKHNLAFMIIEAWGRTLDNSGLYNSRQYYSLTTFPGPPCYYHLNVKSQSFDSDYQDVIQRMNYLAKVYSKDYTDGKRNFGCSQY